MMWPEGILKIVTLKLQLSRAIISVFLSQVQVK